MSATASARPAATAGVATASSAVVTAAGKAAPAALFFTFEINRKDFHAGPVGRIDGVVQGLFAAAIHAVREDDERLTAVLGRHQFVGREIDGIVKLGATAVAAVMVAVSAVIVAAGLRTLGVLLTRGRSHGI